MTERDYLNPDDDVMFCLTIAKGTLKAGTQILRYMRIVKDDIRHMIDSLENAMLHLKEMYFESCRLAGVSPDNVPEVKEMLEELEEEEGGDIGYEGDADESNVEGEPLEFDPDLPDGDADWGDDDDDDDSYGGRGIVYGGHDN
jgi:hypothetical protein